MDASVVIVAALRVGVVHGRAHRAARHRAGRKPLVLDDAAVHAGEAAIQGTVVDQHSHADDKGQRALVLLTSLWTFVVRAAEISVGGVLLFRGLRARRAAKGL